MMSKNNDFFKHENYPEKMYRLFGDPVNKYQEMHMGGDHCFDITL
jgi:hypothetical protein